MTRTEALNLLAKHCGKSYKELRKEIKDKDQKPCLELLIMRIMESAIAKADIKKLDWIFFQLFGRPELKPPDESSIKIDLDDEKL